MKTLPTVTVERFIERAYPLCKQHNALLLMNSAVENERGLDVDGIHLTSRHLMSITKRPKGMKWVAASCHNLLELQHAQNIGVDFVC